MLRFEAEPRGIGHFLIFADLLYFDKLLMSTLGVIVLF